MIPSQYATQATEFTQEALKQPSMTYKVDPKTKRIQGRIDGLQSYIQAVALIMNTERFAYDIFDENYGSEYETLIGQDGDFVKTVLEQKTTDALMRDDRTISVSDFKIGELVGDTMEFSFTAISEYGNANITFNTLGGILSWQR